MGFLAKLFSRSATPDETETFVDDLADIDDPAVLLERARRKSRRHLASFTHDPRLYDRFTTLVVGALVDTDPARRGDDLRLSSDPGLLEASVLDLGEGAERVRELLDAIGDSVDPLVWLGPMSDPCRRVMALYRLHARPTLGLVLLDEGATWVCRREILVAAAVGSDPDADLGELFDHVVETAARRNLTWEEL